MKSQIWTVVVVGVAVAISAVFYGVFVRVPSDGPVWSAMLEGVLIGGVVCAAWAVARARRASATGLTLCVLVLLASAASIEPLEPVARTPLTWALVAALAARSLFPAKAVARAEVDEPATPVAGH